MSATEPTVLDGAAGTLTADPVETPTPIEISEDSLVKLPGQEKPVKYGEYIKGFQGQFTKASMRASELDRELAGERAVRAELEKRINQQTQSGQKPLTASARQKLIDQVKSRTYLSGEDAAEMVDGIYGEFEGTIGVRDEAIKLLAKKMIQMNSTLESLNTTHNTSSFQSKVKSAISANHLPDEAAEFAEQLYLSYEPSAELDEQFPALLKASWDKMSEVIRGQDKKRVAESRLSRFPGKGGAGVARKPLDTSKMNPRQTADALWDLMKDTET